MNNPPRRIALLSLALAAILTGCGGSTGPHPGPDSPVISNLTIIGGAGCRLEFDYADPNGDVRGGDVEVNIIFFDVPSEYVTITGTTVGRIAVWSIPGGCRKAVVRLFDDAGNASNQLEARL